MKKILIVANVAKEHIIKFHIPTILMLKADGWIVDVACIRDADVPFCDRQYDIHYERNTLSFSTLKGAAELRRLINENAYDVLHCHTPTGGAAARLALFGMKKKPYCVYTVHGFHFYRGAPLKNWLLFYPFEKWMSRVTDMLITINEEDYLFAKKALRAKKVIKIPGAGVDTGKFRSCVPDKSGVFKEFNIPADNVVLTYVAEIIPNKNQDSLLCVLKNLLAVRSNVTLLLVGPDYTGGKIERLAEEMGLREHVVFTGWRDDVARLLKASDIVVPSSLREGLGLNIIEAMACGVPVIAYDNRGHRDIIDDGVDGILVPSCDDQAMADAVISLLNVPEKRRMFIENGLKKSAQYDEKYVLSQMKAVYDEAAR